jgi:hypothetical protein
VSDGELPRHAAAVDRIVADLRFTLPRRVRRSAARFRPCLDGAGAIPLGRRGAAAFELRSAAGNQSDPRLTCGVSVLVAAV